MRLTSKELFGSYLALGSALTSDRRPKKNIRSSWHGCAIWWNWAAVHGGWKSATEAKASIRIVGV